MLAGTRLSFRTGGIWMRTTVPGATLLAGFASLWTDSTFRETFLSWISFWMNARERPGR